MKILRLKQLAVLFMLLTFNSVVVNATPVEWYPIANDVYQLRYEHHYTIFVVTQKGVVAFDPLSDEAAEHLVHAIKSVAPGKPLAAIIYSHWHTDHATGANVLRREFGSDIPIIAHERTLERLKTLNNNDIPLPTRVVGDKGEILHYGGTDVELHYIGYGHTNTMLVTRLPKQRLIYIVDFANNDSTGWRDMPGLPLNELVAMQQRLLNLDFDKVAFGHGRTGPGDRATIKRQITYYKDLLSEVRTATKNGLSEDEVVTSVVLNLPQYRGWKNYDRWFKMNVRGVYRWVTKQ
ncbi:hypothetical protein MNBD_GAMMA13-1949 [hydrothermal vent metagenome]|uniref:Metallo-beta-lactamase domain-containing protein n=1 Tax=hydrothermal vent metagenome TaxID=652676 RepID=A0A3B0ZDS9_9ZZZZ